MILRAYQTRVLDCLYHWWMARPDINESPIMVMPTGSGKSLVIAELTRLVFDTWPESHPRTVVLVPSKELAEQNAEKLVKMLPSHISVGYYSASIGQKRPDADVIVATIGSIYRDAHLLGNIKIVIIDECHLINPDGAEVGRYRQFLTALAKFCQFRVVGCTATPFRGNGVWLTEGEDPLFTGVCATVTVKELLDANYLSPLVRPADVIETRIDTSGIKTTSGDYNIADLAERVDNYLPAVAQEVAKLAADRRKWLAFLPTVAGAEHFVACLEDNGIHAALVCGTTKKAEREQLIADYRAGKIRCLVTVLALATGFDVPDVDCIIWCRPTISQVLYVQGAGRGLRIAEGKADCLWLDFSDTTERMGPVDTIKGRKKPAKKEEADAPHRICDACGNRCPVSVTVCPSCGFVFPLPEEKPKSAIVSNAAIMAHQVEQRIVTYPVSRVEYGIHRKEGKPDSLKVDYYSGLSRVASEWVCFGHGGFARAKAENWWRKRIPDNWPSDWTRGAPAESEFAKALLTPSEEYGKWAYSDIGEFKEPTAIRVNETGKYPEIIGYEWPQQLEEA